MKANEIIFRQNRIVYTLMLLLAGVGLVWSFWQHQRHDEPVRSASAPASIPAHTAANTAVLAR
ncbi:MAG: hypothetical protein EOO56_29475 [Hymenobacter sp.]|nr:MAG: hypothetical protein EOO56_29475 [Hymenobacter sp.]